MRRLVIGIFTAVVLLILFVVLCTFVRRPYETVLLSRFGTLIPEEHQARIMYHWYFKFPTDSVVRVNTRLHVYTGGLVEMTTSKKEPISIRAFAAWKIVDPVLFYRTTSGSDQRAQNTMESMIRSIVPRKIVTRQLDELFNSDENQVHTAQIEDEVAREATGTKESPGMNSMGIQVVQVGFSRMAFPPGNADSVYRRMVAELNRQAIDYQTQGQSRVKEILTQGEQDASKQRSDAVAKAQQIRGEGDAEATQILAAVATTPAARDFYQYWKELDFLRTSLTRNTYLVLSSDTPWLGALFAPANRVENAPATMPAGTTGSALPAPGMPEAGAAVIGSGK